MMIAHFVKSITLLLALISSTSANAELMSVQNLKDMLQNGQTGELAATSYVQGVVEGMLGMDSLSHLEKKQPYEFCKLHNAFKRGSPIDHPAYQTKIMVSAWENQGNSMGAPAVDMVLSYLTARFGC